MSLVPWIFRVLACAGVVASAPNIVVFLTDDQDQALGASFPTLGDATPMPRTRELLVERGATFTGMMVHTPICSPGACSTTSRRRAGRSGRCTWTRSACTTT